MEQTFFMELKAREPMQWLPLLKHHECVFCLGEEGGEESRDYNVIDRVLTKQDFENLPKNGF